MHAVVQDLLPAGWPCVRVPANLSTWFIVLGVGGMGLQLPHAEDIDRQGGSEAGSKEPET